MEMKRFSNLEMEDSWSKIVAFFHSNRICSIYIFCIFSPLLPTVLVCKLGVYDGVVFES